MLLCEPMALAAIVIVCILFYLLAYVLYLLIFKHLSSQIYC